MQSLKSTFVAVLLLGLSLGLYQISDTKQTTVDESLIPAMEISDGTDSSIEIAAIEGEPASLPIRNPFAATAKPLKLPELQQASTVPELGGSVTTNAAGSNARPDRFADASNKNQFANTLSPEDLPVIDPSARTGNVQSFAGASLTEADPNDSRGAVRHRELDRSDRDAGLIAALEQQFQPTPNDEVTLDAPDSYANRNASANESPDGYQYASAAASVPNAKVDLPVSLNGAQTANDFAISHAQPDLSRLSFTEAWPHVDQLVAESRYRDALQLLTRFYHTPAATGPQKQRLLGWLDALAGKVIFSTENHFRTQPYEVIPGESLVDIAARWQVPAQLIYNINRKNIPNPASLAPGTMLKMVDQPFDATIDLSENVMTLFVDGLYAGRYAVYVGISGDIVPGEYRLLAKAPEGFSWRDAEGKVYPPGSPENGYGPHWLGLSGSLCIHALKSEATDGHRGCLGLSPTDAADIYQILSKASTVKIID